MKPWVLLLGCLLAAASLAQTTTTRREVWEWKDANGVTHYSDAPAPGARKIVIVGSTTSAVPPNVAPKTSKPGTPAAAQPAPVPYTRLEIWQPENGASYFGLDAAVDVRIRSEPELQPGDRLLTYLDGKLVSDQGQYEHVLTAVERGAHSVTSVILDAKGNEKIRSQPVVFHIKQAPANNPANRGPALKPPPPPKPTPKPAPKAP
jgi:hypothetical protein